MKPATGRIVHYVSHGTPVRPDGSQAFTSQCRAAIVTETTDDPMESASLCVLNPTGQFFSRAVPHDEDGHGGGTWHWPEREEGGSAVAVSLQPTDLSPVQVGQIAEKVQAVILQQAKRSRRPGTA